VEKYTGARDFDLLITYLAQNAPTQAPSSVAPWPTVAPMLKPDPVFAHGATKSSLTEADFNGTIAKGLWFVQYYTQWCGHCRQFAPTWEKLVEVSAGVQLARVDCDPSRALCANVRGYPQMNLYRDGEFVETYHGSRDLDVLTEYLAALTPPSTPILNPDGEVAVLTLRNFTTTVAQGPAFVNFYRAGCPHCGVPAPIWTQLAAAMRGRITVAEMDCGQLFNHPLCSTRTLLRADSNVVYLPSDFLSHGANAKVYPGPRTLSQLMAFVDVGGIYPPPAMEFTRETHRTVMAAPVLVIATGGTDTTESVATRIREIAREWLLLHGPSGGRTVQFAWQDWKRNDGVVRAPMDENIDVQVLIVDHEAGSRGYGKPYLTERSGEPLKLTAASIFSVLEDVVKPGGEMLSSATSGQTEEEEHTDSVMKQAMRYLYGADAYIMAHPLKVLYWLSLMLGVVYLVLRRCLRAESEVRYDDDKGLE